jgi:IS30 family transposase
MAFDVTAAKQAGYSDTEIAEFLGQQKGFDAAGAIKAGYSPEELITHLGTGPKQSTIGSELKRGAQQVASSIQTAYNALTGSPEEAARKGIERGEAISQIAGEGVGFEPVK